MDLYFVKLVFLTRCWLSINAVFKVCDLKVALLSKTITAKSMWERSVWDKLACVVACMKDVNCRAFIYSPSKKTCLGYPMAIDYYQSQMTDGTEDNFMGTTCRGDSSHGKPCSRDDECRIRESVCYMGVCLCRLGLYFSPLQNTCLKECAEYGEKMDFYKGVGIKDNNDRVMPRMKQARCCEVCVQEQNFTCRTFESSDRGDCLLSRYGFLDVDEKYRQPSSPGWTIGQRQCKYP